MAKLTEMKLDLILRKICDQNGTVAKWYLLRGHNGQKRACQKRLPGMLVTRQLAEITKSAGGREHCRLTEKRRRKNVQTGYNLQALGSADPLPGQAHG